MPHQSNPTAANEASALVSMHLFIAFAEAGAEPSTGMAYAIRSGLIDAARDYAYAHPVLASDMAYLQHHVTNPGPYELAVARSVLDRLRALLAPGYRQLVTEREAAELARIQRGNDEAQAAAEDAADPARLDEDLLGTQP